jgi:lipooligosaccharide transport system permease protein
MRGTLYSAAFLLIMLAMGLVSSWWAVLVLPVAVVVAAAFGSIGMASVAFFRSYQDFEWIMLAIMPMFLFSATFYPLSTYPPVLQGIVQWTPLYQGVALTRALTTGVVDVGLLWHVAYLAVMVVAGLSLTARRLERLLLR